MFYRKLFTNISSATKKQKLLVMSVFILGGVLLTVMSQSIPERRVFINGKIYSADKSASWHEAMLIEDGRITKLGSTSGLKKEVDRNTELIDLNGRMVMPGLHDAHSHLFLGSVGKWVNCYFANGSDLEQIIDKLKVCNKTDKKTEGWLIGGNFDQTIFPNSSPENSQLSEAFPDTPVYITDFSQHKALVNKKGLELLGLNRESVDPKGGYLGRDPTTGELNGFLVEEARFAALGQLPLPGLFDLYDGFEKTIAEYNSYGTTSTQDAASIAPMVRVLQAMDWLGELTVSVDLHWPTHLPDGFMDDVDPIEEWIDKRSSYATDNIHVNGVKVLLDGVPLPPKSTTAELDLSTGLPIKDNLLLEEKELAELFIMMDKKGLKIKTHSVGQGAARAVMNAADKMRKANGFSGIYHDLTHGQSVMEHDTNRPFANQSVIEFSPSFWAYGSTSTLNILFQFKTALATNALVTAGTDWPVVDSLNLFPSLAGMLDNGDESIDLKSAIAIHTINGAKSIGRSEEEGSIEVGKWATFIILDRNIFESTVQEIAETKVQHTYFKGNSVYSNIKI